jgi:fructose-1,6-bisphosphatase/sedoheptulose 1,7-bisphosphatase-like protein
MIRTTINLPVQLHHELQFVAKDQQQTMADLVRTLLARTLAQHQDVRMKRVYAALAKVNGIAKGNMTDVSATLNERLYGQAGAWKGRDA